jgi:hypothetical protein
MRNVAILLLVTGLTGTPVAGLSCQWLCAPGAMTPAAAGHCHDTRDGTGTIITGANHSCDHASSSTTVAALLTSPGGLSYTLSAPVASFAAVWDAHAIAGMSRHDNGPPGIHSFAPTSSVPLRI